jgi:hypothetical protein
MLRRIFRRAAALALPVTLAICVPPLAVIALNLHAAPTGLQARYSYASRDFIASTTALSGKATSFQDSRIKEHRAIERAKLRRDISRLRDDGQNASR